MKKIAILNLIIILFCIPDCLFAAKKSKDCLTKPGFDIIVENDFVHLNSDKSNIKITTNGMLFLNEYEVLIDKNMQNRVFYMQENIREKLPLFKEKAYFLVNEIHEDFIKAVNQKLGSNSNLLKNIDDLKIQILKLLPKSITIKDDAVHFYHKAYNNLQSDGKTIGKDIFYNVLGDSIKNFSIVKNYKTIKKIANNEWKIQKRKLRSLEAEICEFLTQIDKEYNEILNEINTLK